MQSGKKLLCAALSLLILAVLLLPDREAYAYTAPDFRDAEFHEAAAMIGDRVKLDVSCLDQGGSICRLEHAAEVPGSQG